MYGLFLERVSMTEITRLHADALEACDSRPATSLHYGFECWQLNNKVGEHASAKGTYRYHEVDVGLLPWQPLHFPGLTCW